MTDPSEDLEVRLAIQDALEATQNRDVLQHMTAMTAILSAGPDAFRLALASWAAPTCRVIADWRDAQGFPWVGWMLTDLDGNPRQPEEAGAEADALRITIAYVNEDQETADAIMSVYEAKGPGLEVMNLLHAMVMLAAASVEFLAEQGL